MKTKKSLCKSHITMLQKVRNQLSYRETMNYTQLILSEQNNDKVVEAKHLIDKAINLLEGIV